MALTTTLVSVEEYLNSNYKPACEYRDGVLTQKPMPTFEHSLVQGRIAHLVWSCCPEFVVLPELTVRIRPGRYLVPDVSVQSRSDVQRPYPVRPIHLCVEILSPDDSLAGAEAKCREYGDWGVPHNWVIDPVEQRAWRHDPVRGLVEIEPRGALTAGPIAIQLAELFAIP